MRNKGGFFRNCPHMNPKSTYNRDFSQVWVSECCKSKARPISVNLPVTNRCNYDCRFCFAVLRDKKTWVDDSRIMEIPNILRDMGTEKITLEGGEPFLYEKLEDLLKKFKETGMTTSVISNGSLITEKKLERLSEYIDWLTLSIDSTKESVEKELGRGQGNHVEQVITIARKVKDLDIKLKLNTVVTKLNLKDDLTDLFLKLGPERVKMFQVLPIKDVNDSEVRDLEISEIEFRDFVNKHSKIEGSDIKLIGETNKDMICSYLMLLPNGRFFNNKGGEHNVSEHTIFDDPEKALIESQWDEEKFSKRGGNYEW